MSLPRYQRRGSSYLEIQVAMVLLSIGMAGLYSMSVVQTRQTAQLTNVLPAGDVPSLNPSAIPWARKLGVYASVDAVTVPADPILPYSYVERVIDNLDGPPSVTTYKHPRDKYDWVSWMNLGSYRWSTHYHRSYGRVGSYMEFKAAGLPPGEYEVLTTYRVFASLGTAIPHRIYDGATLRASVKVNQQVATSEVRYDGRYWDRLAVVQVNSGTLRVRLADGPGCKNFILGDAVLIRSARSLDLVSVAQTAGGGATAVLEAP